MKPRGFIDSYWKNEAPGSRSFRKRGSPEVASAQVVVSTGLLAFNPPLLAPRNGAEIGSRKLTKSREIWARSQLAFGDLVLYFSFCWKRGNSQPANRLTRSLRADGPASGSESGLGNGTAGRPAETTFGWGRRSAGGGQTVKPSGFPAPSPKARKGRPSGQP